MDNATLIEIGAKHSAAGQFGREFSEESWLAAAHELLAVERERCAQIVRDFPYWLGPQAKAELMAALMV
ncbi:MAG: hypothetical protein PHI97_00580 [Desulfobulbus sp.]|jgi:hypothetical protein|nr:hypothetical protein [Desulfobulbus sp.]